MRRHLSYANVMSTIAVFGVIAGGGAYAASQLDKDSVGSKQIKAGAVKDSELANDSVTAPKVANGSLRSEDFASGQLPGGPAGPAGATGPQGAAGSARAYGTVRPQDCAYPGSGGYFICTPTRAKGIGTITRFFPGVYCVSVPGIAAADIPAVASVDLNSTQSPLGEGRVIIGAGAQNSFCPAEGAYEVRTERQNGNGAEDVGFTIIVP
jgi:hypothetical protein